MMESQLESPPFDVIEGESSRVEEAELDTPTLDADGKVNGVAVYQTGIVAFSKTALLLAELTARYKDKRYEVTTTEGMADALVARRQIRGVRVALEKFRKQEKADILARGKAIDNDAKALTAALEAIEDPIDSQIKVEEARKEAERAAKAAAEKNRVDAIRGKIDSFTSMVSAFAGKGSGELRMAIDICRGEPVDKEVYEEFVIEADEAKSAAIMALNKMLGAAELLEQQAAELAAREAAVAAEAARQKEAAERQAAEAAAQRKRAADLEAREKAMAEKEKAAQQPALPPVEEKPLVLADKMVEIPIEPKTKPEAGALASLPWSIGGQGTWILDKNGELIAECGRDIFTTFIVETVTPPTRNDLRPLARKSARRL
jgi:hypothetical protein